VSLQDSYDISVAARSGRNPAGQHSHQHLPLPALPAGPCNYPTNYYSNKRWCCGDYYHFDLRCVAVMAGGLLRARAGVGLFATYICVLAFTWGCACDTIVQQLLQQNPSDHNYVCCTWHSCKTQPHGLPRLFMDGSSPTSLSQYYLPILNLLCALCCCFLQPLDLREAGRQEVGRHR
jgi:hypothetical protein